MCTIGCMPSEPLTREAAIEFYRIQWTDMNSIWIQSWEMAKIVLVAAGVAATAIQALGDSSAFHLVASCSVAVLALVGLMTQASLSWRVREKWKLIDQAELFLGMTELIKATLPQFVKSPVRSFSTGNFLLIMHLGISSIFVGSSVFFADVFFAQIALPGWSPPASAACCGLLEWTAVALVRKRLHRIESKAAIEYKSATERKMGV